MQPFTSSTWVGLVGSALAALVLMALGGYVLAATARPWLFGLTLFVLGAVAGALVIGGFRGQRGSWSYLIAIWAVVGFCAFFTAPKVLPLPKIQQVSVALEEKLGRRQAEDFVDRENFKARMKVLGVCFGFMAPFATMCAAFALGRRDYERTV